MNISALATCFIGNNISSYDMLTADEEHMLAVKKAILAGQYKFLSIFDQIQNYEDVFFSIPPRESYHLLHPAYIWGGFYCLIQELANIKIN